MLNVTATMERMQAKAITKMIKPDMILTLTRRLEEYDEWDEKHRKIVEKYWSIADIEQMVTSKAMAAEQKAVLEIWGKEQKAMALSANIVAARTLDLSIQSRLLTPSLHQRVGRVCMRMEVAGYDKESINIFRDIYTLLIISFYGRWQDMIKNLLI